MLRPKKHITRKEIRRDPLLETVDQAQAHIEQNKSTYMKVAVGVIGMLIVFNITVGKRTQRDIDASASLGQALISLDRNDLNTAQFQLETINDEFTGTNSGDISEYYLGKIQYESGELIDAEKYLQDFLKKDSAPYLHIPAILMLIDIELNKNIVFNFVDRRLGDPEIVIASSEKAKNTINWNPQFSDLDTIIKTTWNIYNK